MDSVYAFEVWVTGHETLKRVVNARSLGAAKYACYLLWSDVDPDLRITVMRARKLGAPVTSDSHKRTMQMRARPELEAGVRVLVDGKPGVIVGANHSANFDVLLDGQKYSVNVHPMEIDLEHST